MGTRIEGKVVNTTNTVRFCDVCGKEVAVWSEQLIQLLPDYQTADIKEICSACLAVVNARNSKLLTWALKLRAKWCRQFIAELRAKHDRKKEARYG